jgi:hypothetical protein
MKKVNQIKTALMILSMLSLLIAGMGTAVASTTTTFSDSSFYWPGWSNGSSDDIIDSIGSPEFTGGSYTINSSGNLIEIRFNYDSYNQDINVGDLFIDIDHNKDLDPDVDSSNKWDYVFSSSTALDSGTSSADKIGKVYNVSGEDNLGISDRNYTKYNWSNWYNQNSSYLDYRQKHPVDVDLAELTNSSVYGIFNLKDYDSDLNTDIVFSGFELALGSEFAFGFTLDCANDVIFETGTSQVPIPTSIFLLGAGLTSLAGLKRRIK